jgi:enoyl-CoA hydratase/carnithine racemase
METLLFEKRQATARIQLSRPRRRNALNNATIDELDACLAAVAADDEIRAIVLIGDEVAFCAGQDLKEPEPADFIRKLNSLLFEMEAFPKPIIAAIGGWCIAGGLELALSCDLRIASTDAKIGDWHAKIKSLGGAGAIVRLPRLIGLAAAKELIFTGDVVSAERALSVGLVNQVHSPDQYEKAAFDLADKIALIEPQTIRMAKETLQYVPELPYRSAIELSLVNQRRLIADLSLNFVTDYSDKKDGGQESKAEKG